jgi:hypothetical protein
MLLPTSVALALSAGVLASSVGAMVSCVAKFSAVVLLMPA